MKKLLLILTVIFSTLIAGVSYYAHSTYVPNKIEHNIINSFNHLGFENIKFDKITRKNGQLIFSNLLLDEHGFSSIGELEVNFSLLKFLINTNHAKKIIIRDLRLSGELSKDLNLTISGLNNNKQFLSNLNNIPSATIIVENSTIDLLSEDLGGIKINYDGQARLLSSKEISIKGQLSSKQKKLVFQSKINGTLSPDGAITIIAESDQISLTQKDLSLRRGVATIEFNHSIKNSASSISIDGDFPSVNWKNLPLRDVKAIFNSSDENYSFSAKGGTFGNENIDWSAQISKENDIKKSNITLTPNYFYEGLSFLQINKFLAKDVNFPSFVLNFEKPVISIDTAKSTFGLSLAEPAIELQGEFLTSDKNIKGEFSLNQSHIASKDNKAKFKLSSKGEFIIKNITDIPTLEWYVNTKVNEGNISYGLLNISNVSGKFLYNSNRPKKTKNSLSFKLPLKLQIKQSGKIKLNIIDQSNPLFQSMGFNIYDGNIKMQNPVLKDGALTNKNKLILSDIDLTQLFHDAKFKDVVIFGKLGGVIPLNIKSKKMSASGGILQSQGGGIIRLPQNLIKGLFPGKSSKMQRIRGALENYHYDFFEIRMDGDLGGRVMMTLNASGYNPDFKDKDPIDLNLQIETQISLLFENLIN